ncbi:MAG: arginine--tRNA ligase [Bacteroidia bacterium]
MIEYSQPNTHKEMHVGYMRNLALGDLLIRPHRYCGYDIVAATFPMWARTWRNASGTFGFRTTTPPRAKARASGWNDGP